MRRKDKPVPWWGLVNSMAPHRPVGAVLQLQIGCCIGKEVFVRRASAVDCRMVGGVMRRQPKGDTQGFVFQSSHRQTGVSSYLRLGCGPAVIVWAG